jgi:hypothetical protein
MDALRKLHDNHRYLLLKHNAGFSMHGPSKDCFKQLALDFFAIASLDGL